LIRQQALRIKRVKNRVAKVVPYGSIDNKFACSLVFNGEGRVFLIPRSYYIEIQFYGGSYDILGWISNEWTEVN